MGIVGMRIRDRRDGVEGWIVRTYGDAVYSAVMDDGSVRYFVRRSGVVDVVGREG